MAKRKKAKSTPLYKQRIAKLNKLGITNLNSTRKQSRKTQGRVKRLWNEYGHIANNPENYTTRKVNKERQKTLTELDYKIHNDKVFIYKEGWDKVSLKYEKVNGKKRTVVTRTKATRTDRQLIIPRAEMLEELKSFDKARLDKGQFLTLQIGNRSAFSKRFKSYAAMLDYLENSFSPQQPLKKSKRRGKRAQAKLKKELISQMTIVKFRT